MSQKLVECMGALIVAMPTANLELLQELRLRIVLHDLMKIVYHNGKLEDFCLKIRPDIIADRIAALNILMDNLHCSQTFDALKNLRGLMMVRMYENQETKGTKVYI
jgi:hypothetical protein